MCFKAAYAKRASVIPVSKSLLEAKLPYTVGFHQLTEFESDITVAKKRKILHFWRVNWNAYKTCDWKRLTNDGFIRE